MRAIHQPTGRRCTTDTRYSKPDSLYVSVTWDVADASTNWGKAGWIRRAELVAIEQNEQLHSAAEDCQHEIIDAPGGGVKCTKCLGWFCY